ncbi:MAG: TonB-dependent receptor [Cyclobacteriaceae bacterium]|nr:TonB-dependent receptor [Cyclobacteriaceae bacterium]
MFRYILVVLLAFVSVLSNAQVQLSGFIRDAQTGEPLAGATVQITPGGKYSLSDEHGRYSISVAPGNYVAEARFLGYEPRRESVDLQSNTLLDFTLASSPLLTDAVVVSATRASERTPTTYVNLNKMLIQKQNFGQDLPMILNWSPSVVTTSDAGAGVGYTGIRIRGSDATRINVTLNGIPYNDSESQSVYWVDVPDIATSTQSIQIQRGVGTSSNGAGAFGATINLQTNTRNDQPYADVINSAGSFGTHRHTIGVGSGLINGKFVFDARVSRIKSNGFIDRASSDLSSYYLSGGYYGKKTMIKAIVFGGKEVTYQSWWGVPESRLKGDEQAMLETAADEGWNADETSNLLASNSRTFNHYTYKNQVDNYGQDHFQLHASHRLNDVLTANIALHGTLGKGYYEEYKPLTSLAAYGVTEPVVGQDTIRKADLIRRLWLDNKFYGVTYSLNYESEKINSVFGGGWNDYVGDHFGEITWAAVSLTFPKDYRFYFNQGRKRDFNLYWKTTLHLSQQLAVFGDLQVRTVAYSANGTEAKLQPFDVSGHYQFFNPKIGLTWQAGSGGQWYASWAVGNREPVRDDFVNASAGKYPLPERLNDLETGYRLRTAAYQLNANFYFMKYKDQLVLTGQLNEVGASIRTNVPESYRAGLELDASVQLGRKWRWSPNLTLSRNKIATFTEVLYDYGENYDQYNEVRNTYHQTDISFSPSVIAGSVLALKLGYHAEVSWLSKYVGKQYLDNTSNEARAISAYFIQDLRINYSLKVGWARDITISALVNNVLDVQYESNGYTWGYLSGSGVHRQNYYYPQAGRNYLLMLGLKF